MHLVERSTKKAAFLREAVHATGVPAEVHAVRLEDFVENLAVPVDVVTARALAPLAALLSATYPLLKTGTLGLFPKGQDVDAELTEAAKYWRLQVSIVSSVTSPSGAIVAIRSLERRKKS